MSNAPLLPGAGDFGQGANQPGLREVDGEIVPDGDADENLLDSADADRLASTDPDDQDPA